MQISKMSLSDYLSEGGGTIRPSILVTAHKPDIVICIVPKDKPNHYVFRSTLKMGELGRVFQFLKQTRQFVLVVGVDQSTDPNLNRN